jgi:hypothetical protein
MEREVRMRAWISGAIFGVLLAACFSPLAAQSFPVPFVNNPLVPAVAAPGGAAFSITVNGAGFVAEDVVNWNGSPRLTTFISNTKLTAQILATDIAAVGTAYVNVSNPNHGTSNSVLFQIATPVTSLAFIRTDTDFGDGNVELAEIAEPSAVTTIGASGLAIADATCPLRFNCIMEHAVIALIGSTGGTNSVFTGRNPLAVGAADLTGTGTHDLVTVSSSSYSITPGSAGPHHDNPVATGGLTGPFAIGDFNGDGHPDLAFASDTGINILLGNGDGTFGTAANIDSLAMDMSIVAGDFNGDGNLDLAACNLLLGKVSIFLGNGNGGFQTPVDYSIGPFPGNLVAADFNGDGNLDLAVITEGANSTNTNTVSILLGNGDGTFRPKVDYPAGVSILSLTLGDYNSDGILDLAAIDTLCTSSCPVAGSVNILLGNGDGTFQSSLPIPAGGLPAAIATGEFAYFNPVVGRPGFAVANEQENTVSIFAATGMGTANNVPAISSISPSAALVNSGEFVLTVTGTNFVPTSTVFFGGQARTTNFVSVTQLTADIQASDISIIESVGVFVANPASSGGNSAVVNFDVQGPSPTISSLNPSSTTAGGTNFTLFVNGLNFVNGAVVNFNGVPRVTSFLSEVQLSIAITAADIASPGTINISVTDPVGNGSEGGTTSSLSFTILPVSSQPVTNSLSPASITVGAGSFTLTINGSGFTASSVVKFNSNSVSSLFVNSTQLQASIPASFVAVAGSPLVTVTNGTNTSVATSFTVNNTIPTETSLSLSSAPPGSPSGPITVPPGNAGGVVIIGGTNFNTTSVVQVNGSSRATTLVSATSLTAVLPATDFVHSATLNIQVLNPAPGGSTTSGLPITVEDFRLSVPTAAVSVTAGQPAPFSLMLVPSNATTANTVTLTTSPLPTGTTVSYSPSATILSGSGTTTVTLSFATTPHSVASSNHREPLSWPRQWPFPWAFLVTALVMCAFCCRTLRLRRVAPALLLASLLVIIAALPGCGGAGGAVSTPNTQLDPTTGTPAGKYSIVVTATAPNGSLNTTVTLTVN